MRGCLKLLWVLWMGGVTLAVAAAFMVADSENARFHGGSNPMGVVVMWGISFVGGVLFFRLLWRPGARKQKAEPEEIDRELQNEMTRRVTEHGHTGPYPD